MDKLTFLQCISPCIYLPAKIAVFTFENIIVNISTIFLATSAAAKEEEEDEDQRPYSFLLLYYKCQQMDRNFDIDQIYFTTNVRKPPFKICWHLY